MYVTIYLSMHLWGPYSPWTLEKLRVNDEVTALCQSNSFKYFYNF